jgi:hypothetical protein
LSNPSALAARNHLVQALEADLVGPFQPDQAETFEEVLSLPASRWYLTGFLAPEEGREAEPEGKAAAEGLDTRLDPTPDDEFATGPDDTGEDAEPGAEPEPKQKNRLPASIGLTVLLPAGGENDVVRATVSFADYVPEEVPEAEEEAEEGAKKKRPLEVWRRVPGPPVTVEVRLNPAEVRRGIELPGTDGIWLMGRLETVTGAPDRMPVPKGTRALSLFVVNRRRLTPQSRPDEAMIFQVRLEIGVGFGDGLVARPNRKGEASDDWDDRVADLQFRHRCEHAVGHGVSVMVPPQPEPVRIVRTTWIPCAQVHRVEERRDEAVTTAMEDLAALPDGTAARRALAPLVESYGGWIKDQRRIELDTAGRRKTRDDLMELAEKARGRIAAGISLLENDPEALEAFRLANRAMAMAARRSREYKEGERPQWRLFQLAFVLLNLAGIADERHADRETVELIFFPTGGGKTEAYLGVIAFTLVLRRMRGRSRPDAGLGVAVLLRYTLRLLTLDQLARAATLVCALESLRRDNPEKKLGEVRFTVGLWVGRSATANRLEEVDLQIKRYKSRQGPSPFPLTHCPWCGTELGPDSLTVHPKSSPREVVVSCLNHRGCEFSTGRHPDGLPVLFVDEQIYRELPGFLVATVDKFAMLPWRGEAGMLFGNVHTREGRRFAGPVDGPFHADKTAVFLPDGLKPPELIVQDELHLISGPLGTMVGLYETAIEALSTSRDGDARPVLPKILASTATVRRAREQIRALFGRESVAVFPPAGVDDSETWFAEVDRQSPGRLYVGVAASGRAMKAILLRAHVALLAAAQRIYDEDLSDDPPADAYMTLAGYFNSLRELGAMRRLVEDEVRGRCIQAEDRKPVDWPGPNPWFRKREIHEPAELTSRESTARIAATRSLLKKPFRSPDHVDVLLASSMISVGVDIERLGLMVVAGQPKATSEYIQASSRVGRRKDRPGLVVTCFNVHKPRDRSHYERFAAFHESFYRFVEASSLTPFSGPALDRGLAGSLVAMTRHGDPEMTPPRAAMLLPDHRAAGETAARRIAERAAGQSGLDGARRAALAASLEARGREVLDAWQRLIDAARAGAFARSYSPFESDRAQKQLLRTALDSSTTATADEERFTAPTSMRDVEPVTHLWLQRRELGRRP